jgi:CRISPR-associated endonuclease Csn1
MTRKLGLDLGTNSIGWSIVNLAKKRIEGMGVRIFPEGVNREKGKEVSKNEDRRIARQRRRQYFRRGLRMERLAKQLMQVGMFPESGQFRSDVQQLVLPDAFRAFFALDPYVLRAEAAEGRKLSLHELGRVFYHLAQRRGYRENLQSPLDEKSDLNVGDPKEGKIGLDQTKAEMGNRTLGQFLATLDPHKERIRNRYTTRQMYLEEFEKIWSVQKSFYPNILTDELKIVLGQPDKGILFFQRPLRNQKFLRGTCSIERDKSRIQLSSPVFELYRMFSFLNTVRIETRELTTSERELVIPSLIGSSSKKFEAIRKKLNVGDANLNFEDDHSVPACRTIHAILELWGGKSKRSKDALRIIQSQNFDSILSLLRELESVWEIKQFARDPEWLTNYALTHWQADDASAGKFVKFRLAGEMGSLSRKAIMNILPYVVRGENYSDAVLLGGVRNAFGKQWLLKSESERDEIESATKTVAYTANGELALDKLGSTLVEHYQLPLNRVRRLYHHSDQRQRDGIIKENEIEAYIRKIKNPIVQAVLFEVRSLVPALREKYGAIDEIKIEMGRDLKKSKKERDKDRREMWKNEEENNECRALLDEHGIAQKPYHVLKVRLWRECKQICPYTGQPISWKDLFSEGHVQVEHIVPYSVSLDDSFANKTLCFADANRDKGQRTPYEAFGNSKGWQDMVDRVYKLLPYRKAQRFCKASHPDLDSFISRQLNDTRYISRECAKILQAFAPTAVAQGGLTAILRRTWGLNGILNHRYPVQSGVPNGRYCAAIDEDDQLVEEHLQRWDKDFKKRKVMEEKLAKLGRVVWGTVRDNYFIPEKSRDDHRHHAIDSLAVAFSERSILQVISRLSGRGVEVGEMDIDQPWDSFRDQAVELVSRILVSYKNKRRVLTDQRKKLFDPNTGKRSEKNGKLLIGQGTSARGQLHADTYYGLYLHSDGKEYLHTRKDLDSRRSWKQIEEIVDPRIREAIWSRLETLGYSRDDKKLKLPEDYADRPIYFDRDSSGKRIPLIFLPNKHGEPIPVKKVRVATASSGRIQLHGVNRYVEPGNNHHTLIYEREDGSLASETVPFWVAVERVKLGLPLYQLPADGKRIVTTLQINQLFILGLPDSLIDWSDRGQPELQRRLYRVQKISDGDYSFRLGTATSISYDSQLIRIRSMSAWEGYKPVKVKIDRIGRLIKVE